MFGLHSDLDKSIWDESEAKPPENKKTWEEYQPYGITRVTDKGDHIKYILSTSTGSPIQALLYGTIRNPLKDVGNCYMKVMEKKVGAVIAGIAVEEDWVIMKLEHLNIIEERGEAEREAERLENEKKPAIDMGIFGDLQCERWVKKGESPRQKSKLGYEFYEVIRSEQDETNAHQVKLFLCSSTGNQVRATLTCALRNAFHSITRGYFKIENGIIKGVMVEEEWVEMK